MKIAQIISPLVLVVAGSALSNAATLFDTDAGTTITQLYESDHSSDATTLSAGPTAEVVSSTLLGATYDAESATPLTAGWHWGLNNLKYGITSNSDIANDVAFTADGSFTFQTRGNFHGEFVLSTVSVSSLLASSEDDELENLSVSFTASDSVYFSAYYVASDNTTVTQLGSTQTGESVSYYVDGLSYTDGTLLLLWGNGVHESGSGSTVVTVSNITSSYNNVPEPSMFGLLAGLGALGFVAARRRRNRKA